MISVKINPARRFSPLFVTFFLFVAFCLATDDKETPELVSVRNPLVDSGTELIALDPKEPIWVNADRNAAILIGSICLREGLLELFACRTNSKEHESIIAIDVRPHLIHAALLVIGATQGSPARFDPIFEPPKGELIDIEVRWEANGKIQKIKSQEMIREVQSQKEMSCQWVFTGGLFANDSKGKRFYLADISGEIFGVSNFPGSVLDVPFESSSENELLYYEPNTEKIPPIGTPVTLILTKLSATGATGDESR